jgi:hypothetical protein
MKTIAIIFHENDRKGALNYLIMRLADIWRSEDIVVIPVFGTKRYVPADLAILHIDLSVVPDKYIKFARKYPIVINGTVMDIRKSTFIDNMVLPGDNYEGKVIIKSDFNYAGVPERRLQNSSVQRIFWGIKSKLGLSELRVLAREPSFRRPSDYIILDSPDLIPKNWFKNKDIVIQKFLPEMDHGHYCIRNYYFLGDRYTCLLRKASHPIVNAGSTICLEPIEVDPEIAELRRKFRFDYGKFDYVVHEGVPVLVDINKTIGSAPPGAPYYPLLRSNLAAGIYSYFS